MAVGDRIEVEGRMQWVLRCAGCDVVFVGRRDRRWCSSACRMRTMRRQKRSGAPDGLAAALAQLRAAEAENERLRAELRRLGDAGGEVARLETEIARLAALRAAEQQANDRLRKRLHADDRKRLVRGVGRNRKADPLDDATRQRIGAKPPWTLPPPAG